MTMTMSLGILLIGVQCATFILHEDQAIKAKIYEFDRNIFYLSYKLRARTRLFQRIPVYCIFLDRQTEEEHHNHNHNTNHTHTHTVPAQNDMERFHYGLLLVHIWPGDNTNSLVMPFMEH